jgi:hypothetical protein
MPGTYWHHDDFLFETQFPTGGLKDSPNSSAADELLERFLQRLRRTGFARPQPQPRPQPAVVDISISPEIVRAFQSVCKDLLANLCPPSS